MRKWRNWQTRWLQVPVIARSWGFKSPLAHKESLFKGCEPGFESFLLSPGFCVPVQGYSGGWLVVVLVAVVSVVNVFVVAPGGVLGL